MPRSLNIGDRLYFIKNNKVESSMEFCGKGDELSGLTCEVTGRVWQGCLLLLRDLRNENLPFTIKGFQGFRYRWWEV